jgi:hypothetical protein
MELRSDAGKAFDVVLARLGDHGKEVDVRGLPTNAVVLRNDEATKASQLDRALQSLIEIPQEGPPWFRGLGGGR